MRKTLSALGGRALLLAVALTGGEAALSAQTTTTGPCGEFLDQPELTGNVVNLRHKGTPKYLVIPVYFNGSSPGFTQLGLDEREFELAQAMDMNSYGAVVPEIRHVWPPVELPLTAMQYNDAECLTGKNHYYADIIEAANEWAMNQPHPEDWYPVEDMVSREIIVNEALTGATSLATRAVHTPYNRSGYVWAHEIGHTLLWEHANFLRHPETRFPEVVPPQGPACNQSIVNEYGDRYDTMGDAGNFHHFNPWYKTRAGWLSENEGEIATIPVDVSGTYWYWIERLDLAPGTVTPGPVHPTVTALRVPRTPKTDTWVFFRGELGPTQPQLEPGALLSWGHDTNIEPSWLLDMTPGSISTCTTIQAGGLTRNLSDDHQDGNLMASTPPPIPTAFPVTDVISGDFKVTYTNLTAYPNRVLVKVEVQLLNPVVLDQRPIVQVVSPAEGEVVSGVVTYKVMTRDPDSGQNMNGEGIESVKLEAYGFDENGVIGPLRYGLPITGQPFASVTKLAPPYELVFDTTGPKECNASSPTPRDGLNLFVITVTACDGGSIRIPFSYLLDNAGPSTP